MVVVCQCWCGAVIVTVVVGKVVDDGGGGKTMFIAC
jgi:hypothetical protein